MRVSSRLADDARVMMGQVAGTLFLIGSAMTVLAILLPHSPKADIGGFCAMAGGTGLLRCCSSATPDACRSVLMSAACCSPA